MQDIRLRQDTCNWSIQNDYYTKSLALARFGIFIYYEAENFDNQNSIDSFILAHPLPMDPTALYLSVVCARRILSNQKEAADGNAELKSGFGVILQCILLKYVKNIGFLHAYADASHIGLVPYYTRFGFRLGKEPCGQPDSFTEQHDDHLKATTTELFYTQLKDYKTPSGFRMKLCNNECDALCTYSREKFVDTCQQLAKYDDIYYIA